MKKYKYLVLFAIASVAAPLTSCVGGGESSSLSSSSGNVEQILINNAIASLRKGFRVTADLTIHRSYFQDAAYQIPDTNLENETIMYRVKFIYENADDYMGVDRRYYQVDEEGKESYIQGENSYNANGYAGLVYLDYDNTIVRDLAIDSNYEFIPYGSNGMLNPFTLISRSDFHQIHEGFELNHSKTNLFFSNLFSQIEDYQSNIVFSTRVFTLDNKDITGAHFVSKNMDDGYASTVSIPSNPYYQTYIRNQYEVEMSFTDIAVASARDVIQVEPEKEENIPLKNALENMVGKNIALTRELHPYINGSYVGEDSYNATYYMGETEGIYSQVYSLAEGESVPTAPSASDFILRPLVNGGKLRVYQVNATTGEFLLNSSNYTSIDNIYTYNDLAYDISFLNPNIFNLNEDGSYSPTIDNVPWITRDVFMSALDSFSAVDSGYVNDVKVYVDEEVNCLDRVVATYEDFVGYSGTMTLHFDKLGEGTPDFEIVIA